MKITKRQLRQIIKEETAKALGESDAAHSRSRSRRRTGGGPGKHRDLAALKRREAERNAAKDKDKKDDLSEISDDEADAMMSDRTSGSGWGLEPTLTRSGHGESNVDIETEAKEIAEYYGVDPMGVSVSERNGESYIVVQEIDGTTQVFVDLDDLADGLDQGDY